MDIPNLVRAETQEIPMLAMAMREDARPTASAMVGRARLDHDREDMHCGKRRGAVRGS